MNAASPEGVRIDLAPGRRQPREIDLTPGTGKQRLAKGTITTRIGKDAVLSYRLEVEGGGSGGDEGLLIGTLVLGAATLDVGCVTQAEGLQAGDAAWCLEELSRLREAH